MKKKLEKTDGIGPLEVKKIRTALRMVWHRCHARKLAVSRCTDDKGWTRCEKCHKKTPKIKIDHIIPVGLVDEGFIKRLFCPSNRLMALCNECHKAKTRGERKKLKYEPFKALISK